MDHHQLIMDDIGAAIQAAILFVAMRGLRQVNELVTQNSHARQRGTLEWLEKYLRIVNTADQRKHARQTEYPMNGIELKDYTFKEALLIPIGSENWITFANSNRYYNEHKDALAETMRYANEIELISAALLQEAWDLDIAQNLIAGVHCSFVEDEAFVYCRNRHDTVLKTYDCTIELYKKFKPIVGTREEQLKRTQSAIDTAAKETGNAELKKILENVAGDRTAQ